MSHPGPRGFERPIPVTTVVLVAETTYSLGSDEQVEKDAAAKGCVVVRPTQHELFIDIDTEAQWKTFQRNVQILQRYHELSWKEAPSKSGGTHKHVYLTFHGKVVDDAERVALQAMLGSDPTRELLGHLRVESKVHDHPTVFFEKLP